MVWLVSTDVHPLSLRSTFATSLQNHAERLMKTMHPRVWFDGFCPPIGSSGDLTQLSPSGHMLSSRFPDIGLFAIEIPPMWDPHRGSSVRPVPNGWCGSSTYHGKV
jgi:hypothetical protein